MSDDDCYIGRARDYLRHGDEILEESVLNMKEALDMYDLGISELEKHSSLEESDEAIKLMVTLKDLHSTQWQTCIRCGLMACFNDNSDEEGNTNMARNCRNVMSESTYVLDRPDHATPTQIQKCRAKRMACAMIIETKLGMRRQVTEDERGVALADAEAMLTEADPCNWGEEGKAMAEEAKIDMGVPNHNACANAKCKKTSDNFSQCSRCKSVVYCSRECQKKHFGNHKNVCKRIAKKKTRD
jgi:hypothetical protein